MISKRGSETNSCKKMQQPLQRIDPTSLQTRRKRAILTENNSCLDNRLVQQRKGDDNIDHGLNRQLLLLCVVVYTRHKIEWSVKEANPRRQEWVTHLAFSRSNSWDNTLHTSSEKKLPKSKSRLNIFDLIFPHSRLKIPGFQFGARNTIRDNEDTISQCGPRHCDPLRMNQG